MKSDSGIVRQLSASYNSSQIKVHQKYFIDRCIIAWLTSKASREALTCYISGLKSIGSAVLEL